MCSRVAASIAAATGFGGNMIVPNELEYERRALELAGSLVYEYIPPDASKPPHSLEAREQRRAKGELAALRQQLFLTREHSPLFDTKRWVRNLEKVRFFFALPSKLAVLIIYLRRDWSKPGGGTSTAPNSKTRQSGVAAKSSRARASGSTTTQTARTGTGESPTRIEYIPLHALFPQIPPRIASPTPVHSLSVLQLFLHKVFEGLFPTREKTIADLRKGTTTGVPAGRRQHCVELKLNYRATRPSWSPQRRKGSPTSRRRHRYRSSGRCQRFRRGRRGREGPRSRAIEQ